MAAATEGRAETWRVDRRARPLPSGDQGKRPGVNRTERAPRGGVSVYAIR